MPPYHGHHQSSRELLKQHTQQDQPSQLHPTGNPRTPLNNHQIGTRPPRTSSLLPTKRSTTPQTPGGDAYTQRSGPVDTEELKDIDQTSIFKGHGIDKVPQVDIPLPGSVSPPISDSLFDKSQDETLTRSIDNAAKIETQYRQNSSPFSIPVIPTLRSTYGEEELPLASDRLEMEGKLPNKDTMSINTGRESGSRGHSRRRSSKGNNELDKSKGAKPPSQKAMLSRALQKANTAVQLDNAQNLEGARQAYSEACDLLQQVLKRTSTDEDKRKLEAIVSVVSKDKPSGHRRLITTLQRKTYASRIEELDQMGPWPGEPSKALPARPESDEYRASPLSPVRPNFNADEQRRHKTNQDDGGNNIPQSRPSHQHQRLPSKETWGGEQGGKSPQKHTKPAHTASSSRMNPSDGRISQAVEISSGLRSVRQALPGQEIAQSKYIIQHKNTMNSTTHRHLRDGSQNSWLDGIGDSSGSTNSSTHSRTPSLGYRQRHLRDTSENTEAEFDTALDAAIEAAYDDGYEPVGADEPGTEDSNEEVVAKVLRKVEIAREKVRQSERETWNYSTGHQNHRSIYGDSQENNLRPVRESAGFYDDNSSDEEERILEEMARDYDIEDFTLRPQQIPSETSSSDAKPKIDTYPAVNEGSKFGQKPSNSNLNKSFGPAIPPPQQSLPELPLQRTTSPMQSVRNRRLSGQNPKQLKIETSKLGQDHRKRQPTKTDEPDGAGAYIGKLDTISHALSPPALDSGRGDGTGSPSPSGGKALYDGSEFAPGRLASPSVDNLRHNFSSSSLRSLKSRNLSLSNIDDASDLSPGTPSSNQFGSLRTPAIPTLPTPLGSEFREQMDGSAAGMHLFDNHLQLPSSPTSPADETSDAPVSLEPCPTDFMLRPFWLMRCLFQTIVHTRGGYISTKLFVPREVWRVKGVKLKNIDDKVANCDLLTAALLKLAQVDTCDADAVLEEMQSLEGILEQVQATLNRKLGNEVGVQGSGALFREASGAEGENQTTMPRSASVSTKPSFSWRRLRSKNSAIGLNNRGGGSETPKDNTPLPSLPMTGQPTSRPAKRDLSLTQFVGPNANYMNSLARLFDAAQVIGKYCWTTNYMDM